MLYKLPTRILIRNLVANRERKSKKRREDGDARYIKFALPVEASNTAVRTGKLQKVMQQISEDLKPEAAYFFPTPTEGQRGGFFIVEMQESSQIVEMAERFFFGLNAKVEFVPVMSAVDLEKGLSDVQNTIQRYA